MYDVKRAMVTGRRIIRKGNLTGIPSADIDNMERVYNAARKGYDRTLAEIDALSAYVDNILHRPTR